VLFVSKDWRPAKSFSHALNTVIKGASVRGSRESKLLDSSKEPTRRRDTIRHGPLASVTPISKLD